MSSQSGQLPAGWAGHPQGSESRFELAGAFMRRKWLIVLFGLVGAGLGYLYFLRQTPVYESYLRILVSSAPTDEAMRSMMLDQGQTDLMTDAMLIKTPAILQDAIETDNLDQLTTFRGTDPLHTLNAGLRVNPVSYTRDRFLNMLEIRFRGPHAEDCAKAVTAVAGAYRRFLGKSQEDDADDIVEFITNAKDTLLEELDAKEKRYLEFRESAPLLWQGREVLNIHRERMMAIENNITANLVARSEAVAKLDAVDQAIKRGVPRDTLGVMLDLAPDTDPAELIEAVEPARATPEQTDMAIETQLFPLILEERRLAKQVGPQHPRLVAVRDKIDFTRKFMKQRVPQAAPEPQETETPAPAEEAKDRLTTWIEALQERVRLLDEEQKWMSRLFEQETEKARTLTEYEIQNEQHLKAIERTERLLNGVITRLEQLNVASEHAIGTRTAEIIQPAGRGRQVEPNLVRIMAIAVVLGSLVGMMLGAVAEMSDKSFRGPEDVSRELALPLLGHIPIIEKRAKKKGTTLDPVLCCFHRPRSRQAEAFRGVRNALFFSSNVDDAKVIQITSPSAGDGKSTMSANLAISIANSGKSTVLIDCDLRRPQVHRLLGLDNDSGIVTVLHGAADLNDVIQPTGQDNLSAIPCGPRPGNPAELLLTPEFHELLADLRQQFDFVIIDSPPVLAVSDPGVVAAHADGLILTFRLTRHSRKLAISALETLYQAGAGSNVMGAVINRIDPHAGYGPGRYGGGTYGSGSAGYGFGYGYGYGTGSYYADVDEVKRKSLTQIPAGNENGTAPPVSRPK